MQTSEAFSYEATRASKAAYDASPSQDTIGSTSPWDDGGGVLDASQAEDLDSVDFETLDADLNSILGNVSAGSTANATADGGGSPHLLHPVSFDQLDAGSSSALHFGDLDGSALKLNPSDAATHSADVDAGADDEFKSSLLFGSLLSPRADGFGDYTSDSSSVPVSMGASHAPTTPAAAESSASVPDSIAVATSSVGGSVGGTGNPVLPIPVHQPSSSSSSPPPYSKRSSSASRSFNAPPSSATPASAAPTQQPYLVQQQQPQQHHMALQQPVAPVGMMPISSMPGKPLQQIALPAGTFVATAGSQRFVLLPSLGSRTVPLARAPVIAAARSASGGSGSSSGGTGSPGSFNSPPEAHVSAAAAAAAAAAPFAAGAGIASLPPSGASYRRRAGSRGGPRGSKRRFDSDEDNSGDSASPSSSREPDRRPLPFAPMDKDSLTNKRRKEDERKEERKVKNREAANRSRAKKRVEMMQLQAANQQLQAANAAKDVEITRLTIENHSLRQQLETFRSILSDRLASSGSSDGGSSAGISAAAAAPASAANSSGQRSFGSAAGVVVATVVFAFALCMVPGMGGNGGVGVGVNSLAQQNNGAAAMAAWFSGSSVAGSGLGGFPTPTSANSDDLPLTRTHRVLLTNEPGDLDSTPSVDASVTVTAPGSGEDAPPVPDLFWSPSAAVTFLLYAFGLQQVAQTFLTHAVGLLLMVGALILAKNTVASMSLSPGKTSSETSTPLPRTITPKLSRDSTAQLSPSNPPGLSRDCTDDSAVLEEEDLPLPAAGKGLPTTVTRRMVAH